MFEKLTEYLKKYVDFSEEELQAMFDRVEYKEMSKSEVFIHQGQVAQQIAFTVEGYFRAYILHDGKDITRDITPLNSFFTALPSFSYQIPSFEIFEAITLSKLLIISKKDLFYLYDKYQNWERFGRLIIEEMFINLQTRLYLFITETAERRYKDFEKQYPDMLREVPLQYVADFLGITKQSLSRLRKNIK